MVSFGFKNEGSCVFRPGRGPANLEVEIPGNLETFLIISSKEMGWQRLYLRKLG